MADNTSIEWAHATVNAISGCTPVSPGCTNCYAMRAGAMGRPNHPVNGLTQESRAGHVWTGAVRLNEAALRKPLSWQRGRRLFWNAHGDPWHESVPDGWIDQEFAAAALTPRHRHLFLTKRSARMRRYITDPNTPERVLAAVRELQALPARWDWPLPNVWLGVSVEDEQRKRERVSDLVATPAAIRWASVEPMLAGFSLRSVSWVSNRGYADPLTGETEFPEVAARPHAAAPTGKLDWIVAGGESGFGARPMHPAWVKLLRDQCAEAGVPFLFKQWGDWAPVSDIADDVIDSCYGQPVPRTDPEGSRPCKVEHLVMHDSGRTFPMDRWSRIYGENPARGDFAFAAGAGAMTMMRIGKKRAGRLLDGVLHDAYPELFAWEKAGA